MPTTATFEDPIGEPATARREVELHCRALVDAGAARWRSGEAGNSELHLESGQAHRFGELGVTRLR